MTPRSRHCLVIGNYVAASLLFLLLAFMLTAPLHPAAGDRHGGVFAFIGGVFLLPLPLLFIAAGRAFSSSSSYAWLLQLLPLALMAFLAWRIW
jgi:hypothetical protein